MRQNRHPRTAALLGLALAIGLAAADARAIFIVNEPWIRLAPDGRSAEAYMRLTSTEGAKLVSATSFAASQVSIRSPGRSKRTVNELDLPAGQLVQLAPADCRIQLNGLTRKIKLGARVPLTLTIRNAGGQLQEIPVNAEVRLHSPTEDESHPHQHHTHAH